MEFKRREGGSTRVPEFFDGDEAASESPQRNGNGSRAPRAEQEPGGQAEDAGGETLVAATTSFEGTVTAEQDLRVRGKVSGEVVCRGRFILERNASASARIEARDGELHGQLVGDIVCSGKLELSSSAVVTGTLRAGTLVVAEGAAISGTVEAATSREPDAGSRPVKESTSAASRSTTPRNGPAPVRREVPSFALVAADEPIAPDPR